MSKSIWTDSELDALARTLLFKYPARGFDRVTQPHQIDLNDLALTPLIESVMAPHRQALRPKLNRLKRELVPALMRVTGRAGKDTPTATPPEPTEQPAKALEVAAPSNPLPESAAPLVEPVHAPAPDPTPEAIPVESQQDDDEEAEEEEGGPATRRKGNKVRQPKIRWTDAEWKLCALALHTLAPNLNLVEAKSMDGLSLRELNLAASMMEPGRQRKFKWIKGAAIRLMQEYERARRERDPLFYPNEARRPAQPEPAPQPAPSVEPEPAAAAGVKPPSFSRAGEQRIFWTEAEWVEIAMEIDRLHPHARYAERATCGALTVQDIMQAQRVLPQDRRRQLRTANMDKLRSYLLQGLREVKALKAEAAAAKHAAALAAFEERRTPPPPPPPNPWEQALRPIVELFARELSAQLVPMLAQALAANQAAPSTIAPSLASVTPLPGAIGRAPEPKPRKMSIGMVSGRSTYADDLNKTFPEVDFVCIESHNTRMVDSVKNCDRVILLTRFTSHSMQDRLKKVVGDRLVLVNGSVTDAKRVIHGLLNSTERKTA